jgi:hypothetical protein
MTMTDTIPRPITAAQAARARPCPLCQATPGTPCRAKPTGDHLARYLDAYTAGQLTARTCAPWSASWSSSTAP